MQKKLSLNGNSWILYISKTFANFMGVNENNREVTLVFKNNKLYVQKSIEESQSDNIYVKKLIKRGGGYGLILTLPLLELLNINPEKDNIDLEINSSTLILSKKNK